MDGVRCGDSASCVVQCVSSVKCWQCLHCANGVLCGAGVRYVGIVYGV